MLTYRYPGYGAFRKGQAVNPQELLTTDNARAAALFYWLSLDVAGDSLKTFYRRVVVEASEWLAFSAWFADGQPWFPVGLDSLDGNPIASLNNAYTLPQALPLLAFKAMAPLIPQFPPSNFNGLPRLAAYDVAVNVPPNIRGQPLRTLRQADTLQSVWAYGTLRYAEAWTKVFNRDSLSFYRAQISYLQDTTGGVVLFGWPFPSGLSL